MADLDGDGIVEEFVANFIGTGIRIIWFRPTTDPVQSWQTHTIEAGRNESAGGHAGMDVGDVDGDGHADLAYSNGWYEAPDLPTGNWTWHEVDSFVYNWRVP